MKKQGPPEPLSEEHFANLKRKKGIPVDDIPAEPVSSKRRRTSKKPTGVTKSQGVANGKGTAEKKANGAKKPTSDLKNGRKAPSSKSKKAAEPESDEEMDDDFGASDLDGSDDLELMDDEMDIQKLGDDFMDSDNSVYDSDQEESKREKFVFSDDEDEDDEEREEKLTAANIEGLSKKLDKQLEEEAAQNEAELREGAIQTNIDGDKLHVLGGVDEAELSAKTKTLLAPDLQMLRTRITETIRVLEDFNNLAEEGRDRVEYTNQLLQDFCAYYGYNEFLAEKLMYVSNHSHVGSGVAVVLLTFYSNLFPVREAFAFFEANEVGLRNTDDPPIVYVS